MTTSVVCVIIMCNHNEHMGFDVQWHERKDNTRNINVIYTYIYCLSPRTTVHPACTFVCIYFQNLYTHCNYTLFIAKYIDMN